MGEVKRISPRTSMSVDFRVTFDLTEGQARALDAMVGYGADAFFKAFYTLGQNYMRPYEGAMRDLFKQVAEQVSPELARIDRAKKALAAAQGGEGVGHGPA